MRSVWQRPKTPAPDIGHRPHWQEKRLSHTSSRVFLIFSCLQPISTRTLFRGRLRLETPCSPAPAGEKAAPTAGLARCGTDLFREFVAWRFVIDPGVVGWADDGNDRRNVLRGGFRRILCQILALPEQRRHAGGRFGLWWGRRRFRRRGGFDRCRRWW